MTEPHLQEQTTNFWRNILEDYVSHNEEARWMEQERNTHQHIDSEQWTNFTIEEITKVTSKLITGNRLGLISYKIYGSRTRSSAYRPNKSYQ